MLGFVFSYEDEKSLGVCGVCWAYEVHVLLVQVEHLSGDAGAGLGTAGDRDTVKRVPPTQHRKAPLRPATQPPAGSCRLTPQQARPAARGYDSHRE